MDQGINKGSDLVLLKLNALRVESVHVMSYGVTLKCFSSSCSAWVCSWSTWQARKSSVIAPFWLQLGFPGGAVVKNLPANAGDAKDDFWVRKIPWSRKWQPTPVSLPGKFHGQRSLAGCSPWGQKELDTTERTHTHTHTHTLSLASVCHGIILFEQELASFKEIFANNYWHHV